MFRTSSSAARSFAGRVFSTINGHAETPRWLHPEASRYRGEWIISSPQAAPMAIAKCPTTLTAVEISSSVDSRATVFWVPISSPLLALIPRFGRRYTSSYRRQTAMGRNRLDPVQGQLAEGPGSGFLGIELTYLARFPLALPGLKCRVRGRAATRPEGDQTRTSRNWRYRAGRAAPPDLPVNISQRENKRRRGRLFFTSGEKFTR